MSDSNGPRPRKSQQKPVFIIEPFDAKNIEHMKGNMTIVLNKRFATDLCRLIRECELNENEGYIYAIQGHIQRWYKERFEEIKKSKEGITVDEAINTLHSQVPEEMKNTQVVVKDALPPNLR